MDISPNTMIMNLYKLKSSFLCTLLCLFCACASQSDWSTVADWDKFDDSDLPDQEDYPDAGAVILLDEGVVEISDGGEIDFTYFERHRVVKILNTSGYSYAPSGPGNRMEYSSDGIPAISPVTPAVSCNCPPCPRYRTQTDQIHLP